MKDSTSAFSEGEVSIGVKVGGELGAVPEESADAAVVCDSVLADCQPSLSPTNQQEDAAEVLLAWPQSEARKRTTFNSGLKAPFVPSRQAWQAVLPKTPKKKGKLQCSCLILWSAISY